RPGRFVNCACHAWEHGQVVPISVGAIHELPLPHMEGPACRVRSTPIDAPSPFTGHDKRAPPNRISEGRACHVRIFGGTCLSRPLVDVVIHRLSPGTEVPRPKRG